MNHFFKSFLNINTTLKLFVEQYGLALSKRVREEETSNFTSINKPLRCMTDHVFELVFQELYTTAKFEEFQVEVRNLVYANALRVEDDVNVCTYVVTVKVPYFRRTRCYKYRVTLQKDNTDVKCECKNFEFRGILCTHILRVFSEENVYYVPQRYILDRWRKDLPREHLKVPVPYYKLIEKKSDGMKRYGDIHGKVDKIAGLAMYDEDLYKVVMDDLQELEDTVKEAALRKNRLTYHNLDGIGKVYGRRVVIPTETAMNDDGDVPNNDLSPVVDPEDRRGTGRHRTRRLGYRRQIARERTERQRRQGGPSSPAESHAGPSNGIRHQNMMSMPNPHLYYNSVRNWDSKHAFLSDSFRWHHTYDRQFPSSLVDDAYTSHATQWPGQLWV